MERPLRFLVIASGRIPSVLLMAEFPFQCLEASGKVEYRLRIPYEIQREDLAWADVVYDVRGGTPLETRIFQAARTAGRKTLFGLDDNLFQVPREASSSPYYRSSRIRNALRTLVAEADLLLVPTRILEDVCRRVRPQAAVELCPVPAMLLQDPTEEAKASESILTIGFAGGTDSSVYLNTLLRSPLITLKRRYGERLRFEFFGAAPDYLRAIDGLHLPHTEDFAQYKKTMGSRRWSLGLAPLYDTPFHRCKYYNKFLEYAASGIPAVYSKVPPYSEVVRHEENGLLVDNAEQSWLEAIRRLIEEPALRRQIQTGALAFVRRRHSMEAVCQQWVEIFDRHGLSRAPEVDSDRIPFTPWKQRILFNRIRNFWELYGWESPYRAVLWLLWKLRLRRRPN